MKGYKVKDNYGKEVKTQAKNRYEAACNACERWGYVWNGNVKSGNDNYNHSKISNIERI